MIISRLVKLSRRLSKTLLLTLLLASALALQSCGGGGGGGGNTPAPTPPGTAKITFSSTGFDSSAKLGAEANGNHRILINSSCDSKGFQDFTNGQATITVPTNKTCTGTIHLNSGGKHTDETIKISNGQLNTGDEDTVANALSGDEEDPSYTITKDPSDPSDPTHFKLKETHTTDITFSSTGFDSSANHSIQIKNSCDGKDFQDFTKGPATITVPAKGTCTGIIRLNSGGKPTDQPITITNGQLTSADEDTAANALSGDEDDPSYTITKDPSSGPTLFKLAETHSTTNITFSSTGFDSSANHRILIKNSCDGKDFQDFTKGPATITVPAKGTCTGIIRLNSGGKPTDQPITITNGQLTSADEDTAANALSDGEDDPSYTITKDPSSDSTHFKLKETHTPPPGTADITFSSTGFDSSANHSIQVKNTCDGKDFQDFTKGPVTITVPKNKTCTGTIRLNSGGKPTYEPITITNGQLSPADEDTVAKALSGDEDDPSYSISNDSSDPTHFNLKETHTPPQGTYTVNLDNEFNKTDAHLEILPDHLGNLNTCFSNSTAIPNNTNVPVKTNPLIPNQTCAAKISLTYKSGTAATYRVGILDGSFVTIDQITGDPTGLDIGEDAKKHLESSVPAGENLLVKGEPSPSKAINSQLDFSYTTPPPPAPTEVHPALTTNFTNVGTPTGGCGVPGAVFIHSPEGDNSSVDSAFNELELNYDFLKDQGQHKPRFSNNFTALNVENTPISYLNTRLTEGNSIIYQYLNPYVMHARPMGFTNSSNGQLARHATLVGDWNDGLNCGRYVTVDLYSDDASEIWDNTPLAFTDNSGPHTGDLASISPTSPSHTSVMYTSDFIVDDSCQDAKTVCRGFADLNGKLPSLGSHALRYTQHHIDLHSYGTMYDPLDTTYSNGLPMASWDAAKHNKVSQIPMAGGTSGNDQNYYIKWHYTKNPYWNDDSLPKIGLGNAAKVNYMPIVFSHLENGIHGILYCMNYDQAHHACQDQNGWYRAKMANDNGQVYLFGRFNDGALLKNLMAVRIIDADDNESNQGRPYTFHIPTDTNIQGAIIQANNQAFLARTTVDCSGIGTGQKTLSCGPQDTCYVTDEHSSQNCKAPAYVPIADVQNDTDYPNKKLTFQVNLGSFQYNKFEKAEIIPVPTPPTTLKDDPPQSDILESGYHGTCTKEGLCSFYVLSSDYSKSFTLSMIGDVAISDPTKVKSEMQLLSSKNNFKADAQVDLTYEDTLFTSYVPIQFTFNKYDASQQYTIKPEDTDILHIGIEGFDATPTIRKNFQLGAPISLAVPFDNSDYQAGSEIKGETIMYEIAGSGQNTKKITLKLVGNEPPVEGSTDQPVPYGQLQVTSSPLPTDHSKATIHLRPFESNDGNFNTIHGLPDDVSLNPIAQTTKTLTFINGVLQSSPVMYTYGEDHAPYKTLFNFSSIMGDDVCNRISQKTITLTARDLEHIQQGLQIPVPLPGSISRTLTGGGVFSLDPNDEVILVDPAARPPTKCMATYDRMKPIPDDKSTPISEIITYYKQPNCEWKKTSKGKADYPTRVLTIIDHVDSVGDHVTITVIGTKDNNKVDGWLNDGLENPDPDWGTHFHKLDEIKGYPQHGDLKKKNGQTGDVVSPIEFDIMAEKYEDHHEPDITKVSITSPTYGLMQCSPSR